MDIAVVDDEKAIREHICGLVFITGTKDYVFDAFDLYAFRYRLKPIDERKFAEVLERAVREAAKKKERRVLFIKSRNLTLDQSEILYIESRAKKVEIHTAGVNPYVYTNNSKKAAGAGNFAEEVQKAEGKNAAEKSGPSAWAGDMVVPQPPSYFGFTYDSSISNKSKEEMTMDEYKQWFMNEMSGMPVSGWYRSTCVGGALTITEECFERMKTDPEWEKTVLGMVRKMYSCTGIMGSKMIGYQVIGATPEQCQGEGIPVKDGSPLSADNEESWWEKHHKRMEELMEEQEKEAVKKAQARRAAAFRTAGVSALAATAYEENISTFSKSVVGNQKI